MGLTTDSIKHKRISILINGEVIDGEFFVAAPPGDIVVLDDEKLSVEMDDILVVVEISIMDSARGCAAATTSAIFAEMFVSFWACSSRERDDWRMVSVSMNQTAAVPH